MPKHDENKDLKSVAKVARVNYGSKRIFYDPNTTIGIRRWGRIDYLVHHCGYSLIRMKGAGKSDADTQSDKPKARELKKAAKAPKLTDKTKKKNKNNNGK